MNLDYKEKYLKYKSKYLFANSLKGGKLTPEQIALKNELVALFNGGADFLKSIGSSTISGTITNHFKSNNELIIEKTLLLYTYFIYFSKKLENQDSKTKFFDTMFEHIFNSRINKEFFNSLITTYFDTL
jgi:hypothetical protein